MSLEALLTLVMSLAGVGSLVAVLVNIGKAVGLVKDGQAPMYTTGAGLLVMVILFIAGIIKPDFDVAGTDTVVGQVAQILSMIFSLVWPLISARLTHNAIKGTPILGKSYSQEQSREALNQAKQYIARSMQRE
jgi:Mg2+/Co2+ transporter CorB